jgi:pSer/pThr/pTyr-binding forkhead associated (FHA) protein
MIGLSVVTEYRLQFRGTLFPIRSGEVILGRSSYASIVVNNPLASREHAVVRSVGGKLEVADLGSKNGTYVNGKRIEGAHPVDEGDVIKIGTDAIEVAKMSAQDPQQLRMATEPGRVPGSASLEGDTTVNLGRSLELAETIASVAPEERQASIALEVLNILTELQSESRMEGSDRRRASDLLDKLKGWALAPEVEQRRASLSTKLAESKPAPR